MVLPSRSNGVGSHDFGLVGLDGIEVGYSRIAVGKKFYPILNTLKLSIQVG